MRKSLVVIALSLAVAAPAWAGWGSLLKSFEKGAVRAEATAATHAAEHAAAYEAEHTAASAASHAGAHEESKAGDIAEEIAGNIQLPDASGGDDGALAAENAKHERRLATLKDIARVGGAERDIGLLVQAKRIRLKEDTRHNAVLAKLGVKP